MRRYKWKFGMCFKVKLIQEEIKYIRKNLSIIKNDTDDCYFKVRLSWITLNNNRLAIGYKQMRHFYKLIIRRQISDRRIFSGLSWNWNMNFKKCRLKLFNNKKYYNLRLG